MSETETEMSDDSMSDDETEMSDDSTDDGSMADTETAMAEDDMDNADAETAMADGGSAAATTGFGFLAGAIAVVALLAAGWVAIRRDR